jgi:hypothetical protein
MNGNTWFSYRLRVDQHPLQFDWEPLAQPRLKELLESTGFAPAAHYHSTASRGLKALQMQLHPDWLRVTDRGYTVRRISAQDLQGETLRDLHRLSQIGFAANPWFVPIPFEAFVRSYLQGKSSKENFLFGAYDQAGRLIAYVLDFLEPAHDGQAKTLVLKTAATDPEFRRQGLCNAINYAIIQELPAAVSDDYYTALVYQGLASESFARHGATIWEHEYVLLAKDLRAQDRT